jgi:23S rRNA (guanosine2251-2'-O)-methyltransferase
MSVSSMSTITIALNNVRSLHNVGAIFRTADAVGASIILGGLTPAPPREEIAKTALGTVETVQWEAAPYLFEKLLEFKNKGFTLYALEQTPTATPIDKASLTLPAVLVVGHEREGVEPDILALCDEHLVLPMYGSGAKSLNVSVAAGIAMYAFRFANP